MIGDGDWVLRTMGLGKCFRLYDRPWLRAKDWLTFGGTKSHQDFWALRNIDIEVRRGECFGIIGRNGAGKSTLLKLLTGVLFPTEGTIKVKGRTLSLLELGSGFNPNLSGRDNILFCGELLGFARDYLRDRLDEIEAFAELGDHFVRPFGFYSTGMQARLAFAMFSCIQCDLFIVDEALSVGDVFFAQKCTRRFAQMLDRGTSVIFVSHDLSSILKLCARTLLLENGLPAFLGDSATAAHKYYCSHDGGQSPQPAAIASSSATRTETAPHDASDGPIALNDAAFLSSCQWRYESAADEQKPAALIRGVRFLDRTQQPSQHLRIDERLRIEMLIEGRAGEVRPHAIARIHDRFDHLVFAGGAYTRDVLPPILHQGEQMLCTLDLDFRLEAGPYTVELCIGVPSATQLNIGTAIHITPRLGPILVEWNYQTERAPFYGAFHLPHDIHYSSVTPA